MSAYRLHADYDHNGRVSEQDAEWAARKSGPGALLHANLDADTRRLPASVRPGGPAKPDRELMAKTAGDDEPLRMTVQEVRAEPGQLFVVLEGGDPRRIAVVDSTGVRIRPIATRNRARYPLPAGPYPKNLSLESVDLPASPATNRLLGPGSAQRSGARIVVRLERDAAAGTVVEDEAVVTLAPFVLIGNAGRLERLYMCEVPEDNPAKPLDDNGPAVADVRAALAPLGVPLVLIPPAVHGGDSWIQDQYQLGFTQTPDGVQRVLLHAPRTRSDAARLGGQNLGGMLAGHFLSRDIGVCQAFWDRELTVTDPRGAARRMGFAESDGLLTVMSKVRMVRRQLFDAVARIGDAGDLARLKAAAGPARADLWKSRRELDLVLSHLRTTVTSALKRPNTPWKEDLLDALVRDAARQVNAIKTAMPVAPGTSLITLRLPGREFVMTGDDVIRLEERLSLWHSNYNYGGNIEVGPPSRRGPAGVVVVGNTTQRMDDGITVTDMDPELLEFLRGQSHGRQSLLEVDTSWLDVGHVDEMLAFVPDLRDPRGLGAVLRAAPSVALSIIAEARKEFLSGLSRLDLQDYSPWTFRHFKTRFNHQGTRPVTHLLRGLQWLQRHDPDQVLPTEPPEIYQQLADTNAVNQSTIHDLPQPASPWSTQDRPVYPASISIFELHYFSDRINEELEAAPEPEKGQLTDAATRLTTEYDGLMPIKKLPVFFDSRSLTTGQTAAFTPSLANLQVAGDRLLIPRPHGPRMSPESAVRVLRAVAARFPEDVPASHFTLQWLRTRGLHRTIFWARRHSIGRAAMSDADQLAVAFADGFPVGMPRGQTRRLIVRANSGAFDAGGFLRGNGWRRLLIPENKVDLFEAWTAAVADRLGYRVHWIEAWYYHVRLGSIHCGTNVLRSAPSSPWW